MLSRVEVLAPLEVLTLLKPRFLTGEDCAVEEPERLELPSSGDDARCTTLLEAALVVEALTPLLVADGLVPPSSGDDARGTTLVETALVVEAMTPLFKELRYQLDLQAPRSSHSGNSLVTQMVWYLLGQYLH